MTFFEFFSCSYSRPNKNLKSGDFQHNRNTFKGTLLLTLRGVETDLTLPSLWLLLLSYKPICFKDTNLCGISGICLGGPCLRCLLISAKNSHFCTICQSENCYSCHNCCFEIKCRYCHNTFTCGRKHNHLECPEKFVHKIMNKIRKKRSQKS